MTTLDRHKKVIVFDLDDTLYSEMEFLKSGYRYIAKKISDEPDVLYQQMLEKYSKKGDVFAYLEDIYSVAKSQLLLWYREHNPDIAPYSNVKAFIENFQKNYQFAIVTDGRSVTQRNKINALGLDEFISVTIISEEIGSEKPSQVNFSRVEESLNGSFYYYIADNVKKDFVTPNLMNWQTICLNDQGNNIHPQDFSLPKHFLPHKRFDNWQQIYQYFLTKE